MTFEDDDVIRIKDWNLTDRGLVALPESFGSITVDGYLDLSYNHLASLPETRESVERSITVGGNLIMIPSHVKECVLLEQGDRQRRQQCVLC